MSEATSSSRRGWLTRFVKRGGGGGGSESYSLPQISSGSSGDVEPPKNKGKDILRSVADMRSGPCSTSVPDKSGIHKLVKEDIKEDKKDIARTQVIRSTKSVTVSTKGLLGDLASGTWTNITEFVNRREIGRGRNCIILSAVCNRTKLKVAVKAYDKMKITSSSSIHIRREASLLRGIKLDGICQFYGSFEDARFVYLVLELCSNGDLMERLTGEKGVGKFTEEQAVNIVLFPLLKSLKYLHALGIIHRDIKPENLFLDADNHCKLGDFGLSIDKTKERAKSRIGTLDYMAPEIFLKSWAYEQFGESDPTARYDEMVDVWACGVLAYEIVVGEAPFNAAANGNETRDLILHAEVPIKGKWPANASLEWIDFVNKTLQKRPERRPSCEQLLQHPWILKHLKAKDIQVQSSLTHVAAAGAIPSSPSASSFSQSSIHVDIPRSSPITTPISTTPTKSKDSRPLVLDPISSSPTHASAAAAAGGGTRFGPKTPTSPPGIDMKATKERLLGRPKVAVSASSMTSASLAMPRSPKSLLEGRGSDRRQWESDIADSASSSTTKTAPGGKAIAANWERRGSWAQDHKDVDI